MVPGLDSDPDALGWHNARRMAAMPLIEICWSERDAAAGMAAGGTLSAGGLGGIDDPSPPDSSARIGPPDAVWHAREVFKGESKCPAPQAGPLIPPLREWVEGGLSLSWDTWVVGGCAIDAEAPDEPPARARRRKWSCALVGISTLGSLLMDGQTTVVWYFSPGWKFPMLGVLKKHAAAVHFSAYSTKHTVCMIVLVKKQRKRTFLHF